jgi:hypothetical protein
MINISVLDPTEYQRVRQIFQELDLHLAVPAILKGDAPGTIYVDDPAQPRAGLILYQHRLYLAGSPEQAEFNTGLNELILSHFRPQQEDVYFVVYPGEGWDQALEMQILNGCQPKRYDREYYYLEGTLPAEDLPLPDGFQLLPVNRTLVARTDLNGMDYLLEELQSERDSVEAFLEKSFGTVMVTGSDLTSWCLSEYNSGDRCEVGIATVEKYQKRGLATLTARAFAQQAFVNGIHTIGWHCWKGNVPSGATARTLGYCLDRTYPAYVGHLEKNT